MKRLIIRAALAGTMLLSTLGVGAITASPAQARPHFGQRYTAANGYIVWVRGDYAYSRVRCTWWAGREWHSNWLVRPRAYEWTTSDAGNWGNTRPQSLNCTYHRA